MCVTAQRISGETFLDLTQSDLLTMKLAMGPAKELMRIIKKAKEDPKNISELNAMKLQ